MGMEILEKKEVKNKEGGEKDEEVNEGLSLNGMIGWIMIDVVIENILIEMDNNLIMKDNKMRYMNGRRDV